MFGSLKMEVDMTITFRIDDGTAPIDPLPAIITPDQLGSFRDMLIDASSRLGYNLLLEDTGGFRAPAFSFEARVCPLALALLSASFDHDPRVITVLDEAQFCGRRVRIWRVAWNDDINLGLSSNLDAAPEMEIPSDDALAILNALGVDVNPKGNITLGELRRRLSDPSVFRRLQDHKNMAGSVETLRRMAAMKVASGELSLAWG